MSRHPRSAGRSFLLPIIAVFAVLALGIAIAPRYPSGAAQPSVVFSRPSGSLFTDLLHPFQPEAVIFGPNVQANTDPTTNGQHEPALAVSRVNTNTVIVASKDYREGNIKRVWIDGSTDGGATWPVQLHMPNLPATVNESDPVVIARDDGRIYVSCLTTGNEGIFITWTDDNGATWQPSVPIVQNQPGLQDKDWFAIDNNPASPYYHRMYMMWAPDAVRVVESHSTNGGLTWTSPQPISGTNTEYTYPVIASDGTVYNFMMYNWGFGQTGTVQMTRSTNGGQTWSAPSNIATAYQPTSPIRTGDQFRFFAILSAAVDPNNGSLYVAWTDNRNYNTNGTDVMYIKSTDGGANWTQPIRLSHDPTGVVRDHHTPVIKVGADSRLHAFWMDRRLDPNNRYFDEWYSSSTDGGATWEPDIRVSTVSQDLNVGFPPGSGNAAGDYWGLDTHLDTVYVAWNDTRSGDQDILVAKGLITSAGGNTPTPTPSVPTATSTRTPTSTTTSTRTATSAVTSTLTSTSTSTRTSTSTPITVPTGTPPSLTATTTATVTATATVCAQVFTDVEPGSTFYQFVQSLSCRGIINGYPCGGPGEPCDPQQRPYFRPANDITRGQLSKIVVLAAGFQPVGNIETFEDVPAGSTFHGYIEALYLRGAVVGYPCGWPGEPCVPPANRPYFRPAAKVTRGQTSKIVAISRGWVDPLQSQTFEDVPPGSTFHTWIENLATRNIMQGYTCGGAGEPCVPPLNRPYFRPGTNITRAQAAKIVDNTFGP